MVCMCMYKRVYENTSGKTNEVKMLIHSSSTILDILKFTIIDK